MECKKAGENISSLRIKKGMTQKQLADKLSTTEKVVSRWEKSMSYPDIEIMSKIANILDVSTEDLLGSEKDIIKYNKSIKQKIKRMILIVLLSIGIAMGIATLVLTVTNRITPKIATVLLSIGLLSISLYLSGKNKTE